ncbi:MAG: hypothetical protein K8R53_06115, partial [Bacteroidales bacterium]|nr:hypothetical protein [Bacteroidales bacterium]
MKKIAFILFGIFLITNQIHAQFTLTDSLKAYYPFNNNANDESGNGNDGTVDEAVITTDRFNNANSAYDFDGVNDVINSNYTNQKNSANTYCVWIKHDAIAGNDWIISENEGTSVNSGIDLYIESTGKLVYSCSNGLSQNIFVITSSQLIENNCWYYITASWNGTTETNSAKLHINGILEGQATPGGLESDDIIHTTKIGHFGTGKTDEGFDGEIDDIRIYNRVLDSSEIDSLYHEGSWPAVAHWNFDEGSGTAVSDLTSNGNDGTLSGIDWGTGYDGTAALLFDEVNDEVVVNHDASLDFGTDNFTVEAIVKTDGTPSQNSTDHNSLTICAKYNSSNVGFVFDILTSSHPDNPGKVYFNLNGIDYLTSKTSVIDNEWHHIAAMRFSGDSLAIYIDHILDTVCLISTVNVSNSINLKIGHESRTFGGPTQWTFNGSIDEVRLSKSSLGPNQLLPFSKAESDSTLVAYYPFNNNANDESGNGHDGTVNGASITTDRFENANSAFSFDGVTSTITVSSLDTTFKSLTFWFLPSQEIYSSQGAGLLQNSGPSGIFIGNASTNFNNELITYISSGTANSYFWTDTDLGLDKINNEWYQMVIMWDEVNSNYNLYLNNIDYGLAQIFGSPSELKATNLEIGVYGSGYFDGKIDDIHVYTRALFESEISQLYANYYPPDTLIAEPGDKQVTLSWDTTGWENLDKVYIYRDLALHDSVNITSISDTSYTDLNLINYQEYSWFIRSKDDWGNMSISSDTITTFPCEIVTDYDGNAYKTTKIGDQIWMAENLNSTHYADGTPLVDGIGAGDISGDYTTKYYFYYNDDSATYAGTYGALYTWAAVMNGASSSDNNPSGVQGVCPDDWHLPGDVEW